MKKYTKRQNEIIETAMKLIGDGGIQKLTLGNIADEIGVTEPAIYRHFESKTDILLGIMDKFDREVDGLFNRLEDMETGSRKKIEEFYNFHLNNFNRRPYMAAVLFAEDIFRNDRNLSKRVFKIMEKNQENLLNIIKKGIAQGEIKKDINPRQAILILMGPLRLLVKKWQMSDYSFNLINRGENLFKDIAELIKT